MDVQRFAVDLVRAAVDGRVRVEISPEATAFRNDLAIVQTSPPVHRNSPLGGGDAVSFMLTVSVFSRSRERALTLAQLVWDSVLNLWHTGFVSEHGWVSNLRNDSVQPHLVSSTDSSVDNLTRCDTAFRVTARSGR